MKTLQIESITVHDANGQPYKLADACFDVDGIKQLCEDAERYRLASLKWEAQAQRWRTVAEGLAEDLENEFYGCQQLESLAAFERAKKEDAGWQFDGTAGATAKDVPPLGTQDFSTLP